MIEVASTPEQRMQGMRGQDKVAAMIFLMPDSEKTSSSFWNKGVDFPLNLYGYDENLNLVSRGSLPSEYEEIVHLSMTGKYIVEVRPERHHEAVVSIAKKLCELAGVSKTAAQTKIPFTIKNGSVRVDGKEGVSIRDIIRNLITVHPVAIIKDLVGAGGREVFGMVDIDTNTIHVYSTDREDIRAYWEAKGQLSSKADITLGFYSESFEESRPEVLAKQALQKFPIDPPSDCGGCTYLTHTVGIDRGMLCSGNHFNEETGECELDSRKGAW